MSLTINTPETATKENVLNNIAEEATIMATNDTLSNAYNLIDGNSDTYWTSYGCNAENSYVEFAFNEDKEFNSINIEEFTSLGNNVDKFKIYAYRNDGWFELYNGKTIGDSLTATFPTIKTSKLKVLFLQYVNAPTIKNISIYNK